MILANYPGHILAALTLLAMGGFLVWTHRGAELRQRRLATACLYAVNFTVAAVLVVLIWDPASLSEGAAQIQNEVLIYVDSSESMAVADDDSDTTRLDRVATRIATLFPAKATDRPKLRLVGFDANTYPCATVEDLTRWGTSSNLAGAVSKAAREALHPNSPHPTSTVAGIVFLTDGQADQKSLAAYPSFADGEIPVAIVGVGTDIINADVAITQLEAPLRTTVNSPYTIHVTVTGDLPDNQTLELQIEQNDRLIRTVAVTADDLRMQRRLSVELLAQTRGTDRIAAYIAPQPEEANQRNNRREATTTIMEEPRLRTLLYTQYISPDLGRVRSALSRIQKVDLDARIDARKTEISPRRAPGLAEENRPSFPETAKELLNFDLIIIGPCDPGTFSNAQIDALFDFVSVRGGGLLLLPGTLGYDLGATRDSAMRALFPAEVALHPMEQEVNPSEALLTDAGERLNLIPATILSEFPADLQPAYLALTKPAATTIAAMNQEPILCLQRVGRGYTALLNLKGIFRLYRENENGGPLKAMLSGLVTYLGLAPQAESRLELYAERVAEQPGQVRFRASVQKDDFSPEPNATVMLTVEDQSVTMLPQGDGTYNATTAINALESTLATVEAVVDGEYVGEFTTALALPKQRHEMDITQADQPFLKNLAAQIGAEYYPLESFPESWATSLPPTTRLPATGRPASVWRTWAIFTALCVALTINWFARRMVGLL